MTRTITEHDPTSTEGMEGGKTDMNPILLTPEEAAEALRIGRCRIYDLIRTRQLESCKIGKSRRIPVQAVHDFARRMVEREGDAA